MHTASCLLLERQGEQATRVYHTCCCRHASSRVTTMYLLMFLVFGVLTYLFIFSTVNTHIFCSQIRPTSCGSVQVQLHRATCTRNTCCSGIRPSDPLGIRHSHRHRHRHSQNDGHGYGSVYARVFGGDVARGVVEGQVPVLPHANECHVNRVPAPPLLLRAIILLLHYNWLFYWTLRPSAKHQVNF